MLPSQWMLKLQGCENAFSTTAQHGLPCISGEQHLASLGTKTAEDDCLQSTHCLQDMLEVKMLHW